MTKFVVEGNDADGAAVTRNVPVLVGGVDGSGNVQTFQPGTDGTFKTSAGTPTALTAAAPTAASVGVASASAVAANASRKGLVLGNTSPNTISLGFGAAAVLNSGVTLLPGGVYTMGAYDFSTGAVNAIASAAASNLAVQEYS